ncbi:MAG TPA: class I SAM-dependent methyltransferase [Vicinamibacterales bacterium]|nr:class I SAM-dependent methyltransferase [Vicinamibacterales bacterium]
MTGLFKWGGRKDEGPSAAPAATVAAVAEPLSTSKILPKLISVLSHVESPILMDLGPVVGSNIAFFGEQLACKIFVEDLFAEVETRARRGAREELAEALVARLARPPASVDGILCWDVFDYLDRPASQALAAHLMKLLKPGGVLYGFFGATQAELKHYTRFIVDDIHGFRLRQSPATPTKRNVLVTRDINRMFEGLTVAESVLLKSNARETLFRKPS